jgi:predicted GNAT superfamily acetyltransferase
MILIRECRGFDELQACVDLQIEVWGYSDGDVIPRRVFLVAQKIGGQAIGAFETGNREQGTGNSRDGDDQGDASSLVGFTFALPGVKTGANSARGRPESYLHSHMLAVKDGYRNQSIGARLKLAQRDDALARGFRRIEWTFDPVEIKNSFLNIHKLGAIVRRYEENFYGVSSSRLQGGLQTDRLVAEWWIGTPHVVEAIQGRPVAAQSSRKDEWLEEILVPAEIYRWKDEDAHRHLAQQVQAENRLRFQRAFSQGLAVVAFTRDARGNGIFHLGPWVEPEFPADVPAEVSGVLTKM